MTQVLQNLTQKECQRSLNNGGHKEEFLLNTGMRIMNKKEKMSKLVHLNSGSTYSIDQLIFDYKQLMIISEQFNSWISYKIVFLHACGYCQFISDVFVAMQVLKIPGTGFMDVW